MLPNGSDPNTHYSQEHVHQYYRDEEDVDNIIHHPNAPSFLVPPLQAPFIPLQAPFIPIYTPYSTWAPSGRVILLSLSSNTSNQYISQIFATVQRQSPLIQLYGSFSTGPYHSAFSQLPPAVVARRT